MAEKLSPEMLEYARSLRWLRDVGAALNETRYVTTPPTVVTCIEKLEATAKTWAVEAEQKLKDSILKERS